MAAIFLIYIFKAEKKNFLLAGLVLAGYAVFNYLPEVFFERLAQAQTAFESGRFYIWTVGFEGLSHHWLFGAGLDNFPVVYSRYGPLYSIARAPHNIYLGFAVELGITGLVLMCVAMQRHYVLLKSKTDDFLHKHENIFLRASFIAVLIVGFFLDIVWRKSFWLLWMLIIMYHNLKTVTRNP